MEVKLPAPYGRFPHQTGVTERSISGDYRSAADNVLNKMVVSHQANRISRCLAVACYRHYYVRVIDECRLARLCVSCVRERTKHPLEMILPRKPNGSDERHE